MNTNQLIIINQNSKQALVKSKNLSDSELTVTKEISYLTNLKEFWINDNQISKLPDEIINLVNLEYLYLKYNPLKELSKNIDKLTNLKVSNTKLRRLSHNILIYRISENINTRKSK